MGQLSRRARRGGPSAGHEADEAPPQPEEPIEPAAAEPAVAVEQPAMIEPASEAAAAALTEEEDNEEDGDMNDGAVPENHEGVRRPTRWSRRERAPTLDVIISAAGSGCEVSAGKEKKRAGKKPAAQNGGDADDAGGGKAPAPGSKRPRMARCGACAGCKAVDCGTCTSCVDMPKFGGTGHLKQACKARACLAPRRVVDNDEVPASSSERADKKPAAQKGGDADDAGGGKAPAPGSKRPRMARCGACAGCKAVDCGTCTSCVDMPKFGGTGHLKQACKARACLAPRRVVDNDEVPASSSERADKKPAAQKGGDAAADNAACVACSRPDGAMRMLLCDGAKCNAAWHMDCLAPPLAQLPKGAWYCPECTERHLAKRQRRETTTGRSHPLAPPISQKAAGDAWRSGRRGMALAGNASREEAECLAGAAHALGVKLRVTGSADSLPQDVTHVIVVEGGGGVSSSSGGQSLPMRAYLAAARGLWVLSSSYIYRSLEEGSWQPEEAYELSYGGVRQARLRRHAPNPAGTGSGTGSAGVENGGPSGGDAAGGNGRGPAAHAMGVLAGVRVACWNTHLPPATIAALVEAADGEIVSHRVAHVLLTDAPDGSLPTALKRLPRGLGPKPRPSKWLFDVISGEADPTLAQAPGVDAGGNIEAAGEVQAGEMEAGEVEAGEVEAGEVEAGEMEAGGAQDQDDSREEAAVLAAQDAVRRAQEDEEEEAGSDDDEHDGARASPSDHAASDAESEIF